MQKGKINPRRAASEIMSRLSEKINNITKKS
jgi:hypothetical protein